MKNKITIVVYFLIQSFTFIKAQSSFTAIQKSGAGGSNPTYGYYEYLPEGYVSHPDSAYPLLIYMGGYGEAGNGTTELYKVLNQGCAKLISQGREFPFLLISPQSTAQRWNENKIADFVNQIFAQYRVDSSRVYFTGLSAGATGIWRYAAYYPEKITAIVPIAGRGDEPEVGNCPIAENNIAVWAFHGNADNVVSWTRSANAVNIMNGVNVGANIGCNPPVDPRAKLTVYPGVGHDSWTRTWDETGMGTELPEYDPFDMSVFDWMLLYKKTYFVVNAGKDSTINLPQDSLVVHGTAASGNAGISSYLWEQLSGPALSFSDSTNNLELYNLGLGTYTFRLVATDSLNNTAHDEITIKVLPAATPCMLPYPKVTGLTSTAVSEGVLLEWIPVIGSTSCKIKRGKVGGTSQIISVVGLNQSSKLLKLNTLTTGDYKWQIRCSCAAGIIGAYSLPSYFSFVSVVSNVALNKPSNQSSTAYSGLPGRAVDGNTNGDYNFGSVTHTNADENAWWQVDLQGSYNISSINVSNRTDCCSDRLTNYLVEIFNGNTVVWTSENHVYPNPTAVIAVPNVSGTTVKVSLIGTNSLSLAEVQVFGISNGTGMMMKADEAIDSQTLEVEYEKEQNVTEVEESDLQSKNANIESKTNGKNMVYPNPSNGVFDIQYVSVRNGKLVVNLKDVVGKIVFEKTFTIVEGSNILHLDINNKADGTYFIQLFQEDRIEREKIIISSR